MIEDIPTAKNIDRRRVLQALASAGLIIGGPSTSTATAAPGDLEWQFETGGEVVSPPAVVNGTVYVGSFDNNLYAVDATTGEQQWQFETEDTVKLSLSVVDGTVYVGSFDNNLYAVDAATGEQQWQFETGDVVFRSPAVVDGTVYVGSDDLYAVDAATGNQQWWSNVGTVTASPAVVDGTVYVGTYGPLYAVDAATGEQQWQFETGAGGLIYSSPSVVNGTVYVGSDDNNLYALDAATGGQQWQFETGDIVRSSPSVVNSAVYVGSYDNNLYAVDAATGEQQWQFETGGRIFSSPKIIDDTVYVGSFDNNLYAVDAATGEQQWQFETGDRVVPSPAVVNGTVYVGSSDNSLYAVETETGTDSRDTNNDNQEEDDTTGFDPAVHGFGFGNWATATETPVFDPPHQHSRVSREETKTTVNQWSQQIDQFDPSDSVTSALAEDLYHSVNRGSASGGHCFGMVLAAQQYHQRPETLPEASESASDISKPTGQYQSVGDTIDRYHNQQDLDFSTWVAARTLRLPAELSRIDYETQLNRIRSAIDDDRTIALALGNSFQLSGHAVLAYDYQENGSETVVFAYDPNFKAEGYSNGPTGGVTFDRSGDSVTLSEGFFVSNELTYQRLVTVPQSREVDNPVTTLVAGLEVGATALFDALTAPIVSFSVFSPVSLTVECPDGVQLSGSAEDDYIAQGATDPEQRVVRYDAPEGDYSIQLKGEEDGQYTVRTQSATPDGTVVEEEQTAMIDAGATHEFRANLDGTENQATLERVDDNDNKNDSTKESDTGGQSLPGPGLVGGIMGIGGGAYWLARRQNNDENEENSNK